MNLEELELLRDFIRQKALRLMKHEGKGYAITGLDISKFEEIIVSKKTFYTVATNVFRGIIDDVLPEATQKYPEKFGTRQAESVLEALYLTRPFGKSEDFSGFLSLEQFCWVLEITNDQVNQRVLRIDLFRDIKELQDGRSEFIGGILHAFKHYSYDGIPLSTGKEIHDIHPRFIIYQLTKAFFIDQGEQVSEKEYAVVTSLNDNYNMRFAFYYEPVTEVYFVKTAFMERKKKT